MHVTRPIAPFPAFLSRTSTKQSCARTLYCFVSLRMTPNPVILYSLLKDKTHCPLCSTGSTHEDRTSSEHHFKLILDLGKNINTNTHAKPTTLRTICTALQITMTTLDTAAANDIKAFKAKKIRNTMTRKSFSCRRFARLSRHVLFIGHIHICKKGTDWPNMWVEAQHLFKM